jgi:hypothetical protein
MHFLWANGPVPCLTRSDNTEKVNGTDEPNTQRSSRIENSYMPDFAVRID